MAKAKLGSGARFKSLSGKIAKEYEKKGVSPEKAKEIGAAAAANAGRAAHGQKTMTRLSKGGRKK